MSGPIGIPKRGIPKESRIDLDPFECNREMSHERMGFFLPLNLKG